MEHSRGVLRIERDDFPPGRTTLRLEGRLGPREFDTLVASVEPCLAAGREVELDLAELRFLDDRGASLLCALCTRGATLTRATGYVRELLRTVESQR